MHHPSPAHELLTVSCPFYFCSHVSIALSLCIPGGEMYLLGCVAPHQNPKQSCCATHSPLWGTALSLLVLTSVPLVAPNSGAAYGDQPATLLMRRRPGPVSDGGTLPSMLALSLNGSACGRSLASDSLELLSAAISDPRFGPDLLQLEVCSRERQHA